MIFFIEGTFTEVKRSNSSRNWVVLNEGLEEGRTYVITVTAVDGTRLVTSEEMKVTLSNPGELLHFRLWGQNSVDLHFRSSS